MPVNIDPLGPGAFLSALLLCVGVLWRAINAANQTNYDRMVAANKEHFQDMTAQYTERLKERDATIREQRDQIRQLQANFVRGADVVESAVNLAKGRAA